MKVVPLSEAKAKLSRYGQLCHDEPIVVTVNGRPSFQLVPLDEDDDLIDRLIEDHPGFRKLCSGACAKKASRSRPHPAASPRHRPTNSRYASVLESTIGSTKAQGASRLNLTDPVGYRETPQRQPLGQHLLIYLPTPEPNLIRS